MAKKMICHTSYIGDRFCLPIAMMTRSTICFIMICLYLFLAPGLLSLIHVVEYSAGDTVTINCLEGCNKSVTTDTITLITWKKINNSHILRFITTLKPNQTSSNFSEPRFSFQDPLTLRIMDAQPSDSGNYICDLTTSNGLCNNTFPLHVSGKCRVYCTQLRALIIYHIYY
ncbi:hypothetical protein AB205_0198550 [Aquarana catesbeiana]|uniref:Ig-like domain-containing protein n=1 Tax=Aquarana catesbeiana TaxID=8400 RepID=A0A2G9R3V3_AQUCT|nr:hypothetical protein AB205_0198550 [Aquarana catesbeiana]